MHQKELGIKIKERRKFFNLTQIDLAEITGIGRRSLQMIEAGKGNPTLEQLIKIFDVLGLELELKVMKNE
ncbi:MAG: helix-turn-helix transcriptional regulator [Bacteroidetes bacterium]|nr:helix-turn-helix transcriptional regulator [Bacteroidota bacterium]